MCFIVQPCPLSKNIDFINQFLLLLSTIVLYCLVPFLLFQSGYTVLLLIDVPDFIGINTGARKLGALCLMLLKLRFSSQVTVAYCLQFSFKTWPEDNVWTGSHIHEKLSDHLLVHSLQPEFVKKVAHRLNVCCCDRAEENQSNYIGFYKIQDILLLNI